MDNVPYSRDLFMVAFPKVNGDIVVVDLGVCGHGRTKISGAAALVETVYQLVASASYTES